MTGLMKVKDAAAFLAVSERTIQKLKDEGGLKHVQIGGAVRYTEADLMDWIDRNSFEGRSGPKRQPTNPTGINRGSVSDVE
jgi:excisionase family DNA binding protein